MQGIFCTLTYGYNISKSVIFYFEPQKNVSLLVEG